MQPRRGSTSPSSPSLLLLLPFSSSGGQIAPFLVWMGQKRPECCVGLQGLEALFVAETIRRSGEDNGGIAGERVRGEGDDGQRVLVWLTGGKWVGTENWHEGCFIVGDPLGGGTPHTFGRVV